MVRAAADDRRGRHDRFLPARASYHRAHAAPASARQSGFAGAQIAAFSISASLFAVFVYTTIYLQNVLHLSPVDAGLVYLPATIAMFVVAGATAKLDGRIPVSVSLTCSLLLVSVGLVMMTVVDVTSSPYAILPGFVVACVGAGVFNPVMSGLVLGEKHFEPFRIGRRDQRRVPADRHRSRGCRARRLPSGAVDAARRITGRVCRWTSVGTVCRSFHRSSRCVGLCGDAAHYQRQSDSFRGIRAGVDEN